MSWTTATIDGRVEALAVPMRRITTGPGHHFFGYYEKTPWDATGRYVLAMGAPFADRQPTPGETATIGMIDLAADDRFTPLDDTEEWSWQQGAMLQWLGSAADRLAIYNRTADGRMAAIVRDVHTGDTRTLPRPIYAVTRDGRHAMSLNFHRLHVLRPGYGYVSATPHEISHPAPDDDGVFHIDVDTGASRLIVSLAQLAANQPRDVFADAPHWVNHLQVSPDGERVAFLHRWRGPASFQTRLYVCRRDGSELRLLSDTTHFSHYDWRDGRTILGWATGDQGRRAFYLYDIERGRTETVGEGVLTVDGHCSYSPDRRWVLNDTYPDERAMRTLMLYRPADNRRVDLARFYAPPQLTGPIRCDLHPRWSRDGRAVCIDSAHEDTRHMYVLDVSSITADG
ncbi:MAG: hypothetical protein WD118_06300 [Phycisphaeraceae bacterium]